MKGVAVPYIIAILLGVGVIGLVGYWLFVSGGQFGGGATLQDCRNNVLTWCQEANAKGWLNSASSYAGNEFSTDYSACANFATQLGVDNLANSKTTCQ